MTVEQVILEPKDQFPIGMRVLAVDDNPSCLLLLERLLQKCQYHVTTTSQAITALKLLRENKNKFDLVISDVHMPDMDGFKLLELVGLDMDLPVIMLSGNGDPKLVLKGITHGACDYLLKPVRLEELKNIWQHVVRRKKFDAKDRNNNNFESQDRLQSGNNSEANRKRKDQFEDEDEDRDENEDDDNDNDDPSAQKKPRVVWSVELHQKFVAAVNHLGIDKAVPKKILDLMNVDKLTRENVASHLQKYRLYLKRISCVANQQANMAAALTSSDSPYLRIGSMTGLGTFHSTLGSPQYHNTSFRSFPSNGLLGSRLNTPSGLGMHNISPSGIVPLSNSQNGGGSILHGMPLSSDAVLDQRMLNKNVPRLEIPVAAIDNNPTGFSVSNGYLNTRISSNTHNSLIGHHPQEVVQSGDPFGNQSLLTGYSSHMLDHHNRCNDDWSGAFQSSGVRSCSLPINDCLNPAALLQSNVTNSVFPMDGGAGVPMMNQSLDSIDTIFQRNIEFDSMGQSSFYDPVSMKHHSNYGNPAVETSSMNLKEGFLMAQQKSHNNYISNNFGSLDDLVSSMVKQEKQEAKMPEGNFGYNGYSLDTCT